MRERNLPHLFVDSQPLTIPHKSRASGSGESRNVAPGNPLEHAEALLGQLDTLAAAQIDRKRLALGADRGAVVRIRSREGQALANQSLDNRRLGIRLLATRRTRDTEHDHDEAIVWLPESSIPKVRSKVVDYRHSIENRPPADDADDAGRGPKNAALLEPIGHIDNIDDVAELWNDPKSGFPTDRGAERWWEIWLDRSDGRESERLEQFAASAQMQLGAERIVLATRIVRAILGTANQLNLAVGALPDMAEIREHRPLSEFFYQQNTADQVEWIEDLLARTNTAPDGAPFVCLLDTGINRGHRLLQGSIRQEDLHAYDPNWTVSDDNNGIYPGHGTRMAGLIIFRDLALRLAHNEDFVLSTGLESVKIIDRDPNAPHLYGSITAASVALVEITNPRRNRVFVLAITDDKPTLGVPTSWSAATDAVASGRYIDPGAEQVRLLDGGGRGPRRLFIVSAGNVVPPAEFSDPGAEGHYAACRERGIQDPAHAWNVLTVGASTERTTLLDPVFHDYRPVAQALDISPWTATSEAQTTGPVKPDVLYEGGNWATDGISLDPHPPDFCLLTTSANSVTNNQFSYFDGTSASTALIGNLCSEIMAAYPEYWPETVRGLVVHSAEWSALMENQLLLPPHRGRAKKQEIASLRRRYGFGIANRERALHSGVDASTLVFQSSIVPRTARNNRTGTLNIHSLPWPVETLRAMGTSPVTLKATLSYFVEPNWRANADGHRFDYASHGLRFALSSFGETETELNIRLNGLVTKAERVASLGSNSDSDGWTVGPMNRYQGSIHSDVWRGDAQALSGQSLFAVWTVGGWWEDAPRSLMREIPRQTRYSLILSLSNEQEVDFWTPISAMVINRVEEEIIVEAK